MDFVGSKDIGGKDEDTKDGTEPGDIDFEHFPLILNLVWPWCLTHLSATRRLECIFICKKI